MYGKDFLDGTYGIVERHHIFGGALRQKSERFGLVVELNPWNHREGPKAAHRCKATRDKLRRFGQRKVMLERGWDADTFIREFGKNYLGENELAYIYELQKEGDFAEEWIREEPEAETRTTVLAEGPGFRLTLEVLPF